MREKEGGAPSVRRGGIALGFAVATFLLVGPALAGASTPRSLDIDQAAPAYPAGLLGGGWQEQRLYGYSGPAGVYACAPGRVDTYLARKACGGAKFPNRFF